MKGLGLLFLIVVGVLAVIGLAAEFTVDPMLASGKMIGVLIAAGLAAMIALARGKNALVWGIAGALLPIVTIPLMLILILFKRF